MKRLVSAAMIQQSIGELLEKQDRIELETAIKWAARSLAAYRIYIESHETRWLLVAEDYYHEALEHGALALDDGETVKRLQAELDEVRDDVLEQLDRQ